MKTEYQIQSNYKSALSKADELDSIANTLTNSVNNDLSGIFTALNNAWQGENASNFLQKGNNLKEKILATARDIRKAASTLRTDAKNEYSLQMNILREFKEAFEVVKSVGENWESQGGGGSFGGGGGGSR